MTDTPSASCGQFRDVLAGVAGRDKLTPAGVERDRASKGRF